jgi:hypothetical protein
MFCPSCGTETTTGLKYCNRCGANLAALTSQPEIVQVSLTQPAVMIGIAMTFLTLGGFALLIAGARILASVITGNDPLIAVIFMGMLTILVVDIFLARQLSKLINAALGGTKKDTANRVNPPVAAPQLPRPNTAPIFQPPTVTENTTRFLENDYRAPEPQPVEKRES